MLRTGIAAAALASAAWASAADVAVAPAAAAATTPAAAAATPVTTLQPTTVARPTSQFAFRDPVTGLLRAPTEEELAAYNAELRALRAANGQPEPAASRAPLAVRSYPNGMRAALLGPQYRSSLKAEVGADGKLVISHDGAGAHPAAPTQAPTE